MRQMYLLFPKWIILVLIVMVFVPGLFAGPDIQLDFRLYEGTYGHKNVARARVETSYFLKPMFAGTVFLDVGMAEEVEEIKKIFNLRELNLLIKANWGWKFGKVQKQSQVMSIDDREFLLQLTMLKKDHLFGLSVVEKASKKEILKTEIILPQQKSSIFGFENSSGKPYFVALHRRQDLKIIGKEPVMLASIKKPKLIRKINPRYPREALDAKIEGKVILEAVTDVYGRVMEVEVVEGETVLSEAAVKALEKWVYEPYIIDGVPTPVRFTVVMNFRLAHDETSSGNGEAGKSRTSTLTPRQLIENIKKGQYSGEPYDFNFKDARLDNVIGFLSRIAGIKIDVSEGVDGRVTCELNKAPWDKALAIFLKSNGLKLVLEGDSLRIQKAK